MTRARDVIKHARKVQAEVEALAPPDSPKPGDELAALVGNPYALSILDVMMHPLLFASWFAHPTWDGWKAFLAALFGLPMTDTMAEAFRRFTGRTALPTRASREGWVIVGRRGGKSRIAALVAVFLACFRDCAGFLAPGERGTIMVLAADRRQARTVFRYVLGLFDSVPALASMIVARRTDSLDLVNGVTIEVHTASFRAVRGYTLIAVVGDEIAFWNTDDSANPDSEVLTALRPALATIPWSVLLAISTPYAKRGELWRAYVNHWAKDASPVLVWQADTRAMNPAVDPAVVERAYDEDEQAAAAEYGAQFRSDVEAFLPREAIDAVVIPGRLELPPIRGRFYTAFVDPSGGSQDSFTLAIAHPEGDKAVLDVLREVRPRFSPDEVVADFAALLATYGIGEVHGDHYGGEWPAERFQAHGILYRRADLTKGEIYKACLPLITAARVELLDNKVLRTQLVGLERRTNRGGRDSIDHGPGAHDDVANAAAGVLVQAAASLGLRFPETIDEGFVL